MKIHTIITLYSENPAEPSFEMFRGLFPVCPTCSEPGLTVLLPAPGIILQLLSLAACPPDYLKLAEPIVSYSVADLHSAIDTALKQDAIMLQEPGDEGMRFTFCYLQLSDKSVIGFFNQRFNKVPGGTS